MTPRQTIQQVLAGQTPAYVPWSFRFTHEARQLLVAHYGTDDIDTAVNNHIIELGSDIGFFEDLGGDLHRDVFGVEWDRSIDRDIGIVSNCLLPEPTLTDYTFPDPLDERFFADIPDRLAQHGIAIGCSVWASRCSSGRGHFGAWRTC